MKHQELIDIGFSEKEARVYLALLLLGEGTVPKISQEAQVDRTTCYHILYSLIAQGLVSSHKKTGKSFFVPEPPERLLETLEQQERIFAERKRALQNTLGNLQRFFLSSQKKPSIRLYEGKEGLKAIYEDTLKQRPGSQILTWSSADALLETLSPYILEYIKRRAKKKIHAKSILPVPTTPQSHEILRQSHRYLRDYVLVPVDHLQLNTEIILYQNKTAFVSFHEEIIGIVIESNNISESMRHIFFASWTWAQSVKKKLQ